MSLLEIFNDCLIRLPCDLKNSSDQGECYPQGPIKHPHELGDLHNSSGVLYTKAEPNIRPFPSCLKPLFQSDAKCEAIDMKVIFLFSSKKLTFIRKVMHLASF